MPQDSTFTDKMERASFLEDGRSTKENTSRGFRSRTFMGVPIVFIALAGLVAVFFVFGVPSSAQAPLRAALNFNPSYVAGPTNATLGFGAIILMSLPDRTDRQDGISLIASNSGIEITKTIYAVRGDDISPKAHPFGGAKISGAYLGSWRTHMDALKYIIDNKIETALLLEDDVDWDVRIKPQMEAFSRGMAELNMRNQSSVQVSDRYPYGLDWDIMHLGAAYVHLVRDKYRAMHSTYVDPARTKEPGCPKDVSVKDLYCWDPILELYNTPADSRVIVPTYDSVGLPAIAVTYRGAQRILYQLSWVALRTTLDWSVARLLMDGVVDGWTVVPPLFSQFKIGGNHDSDLDGNRATFLPEVASNTEGFSFGLEFSARKALTDSFAPDPNRPKRWSAEYWNERGQNLE